MTRKWDDTLGREAPSVPTYYVYRLDSTARIVSRRTIDAIDDEDAVEKAGKMLKAPHHGAELWLRDRLVCLIHKRPPQP